MTKSDKKFSVQPQSAVNGCHHQPQEGKLLKWDLVHFEKKDARNKELKLVLTITSGCCK